jgi:soluble lytic murein transglycosylase-like protein
LAGCKDSKKEEAMDLVITLIVGGVVWLGVVVWLASIVMKTNAQRGASANVPRQHRVVPRGRVRLEARGVVFTERRRSPRLTGAGVAAAALVLFARQTGPSVVDERRPPSVRARAPDYDRRSLEAMIDDAAAAHGISAHLIRAVVQAESAFDPAAVSPVGAQGLMQLMPTTATLMGVSDPFDARQNVFAGTKYLSQLLDRFDGDVALALAGYNAGPTRVARCRGIPPYRETRRYVAKIRGLLVESTGVAFPLPKPGPVGGRDGRRRLQRRA